MEGSNLGGRVHFRHVQPFQNLCPVISPWLIIYLFVRLFYALHNHIVLGFYIMVSVVHAVLVANSLNDKDARTIISEWVHVTNV